MWMVSPTILIIFGKLNNLVNYEIYFFDDIYAKFIRVHGGQ